MAGKASLCNLKSSGQTKTLSGTSIGIGTLGVYDLPHDFFHSSPSEVQTRGEEMSNFLKLRQNSRRLCAVLQERSLPRHGYCPCDSAKTCFFVLCPSTDLREWGNLRGCLGDRRQPNPLRERGIHVCVARQKHVVLSKRRARRKLLRSAPWLRVV